MAFTKLCLVVAFSFVALTLQDDPVVDLCVTYSKSATVLLIRVAAGGGLIKLLWWTADFISMVVR
jgi:hypothetical protein